MYYIYHIPDKKIGVTKDLKSRVEKQQGYSFGEYDVLETSDDIEYISIREHQLQKQYGYRVDQQLYKDLKPNKTKLKSMKINVTEQTTTFPCPVNKLKGHLLDNMGMGWKTDHGGVFLTSESVDWIVGNVKPSYYNNNRCFVYNKTFTKWFNTFLDKREKESTKNESDQIIVFDKIRDWADDRGIFKDGDVKTQYLKLMEEAGELGSAILKADHPETIDAIGDMVVVLTNLSHLAGVKIEDCIDVAYKVISKRKGEMINGMFVKEETL